MEGPIHGARNLVAAHSDFPVPGIIFPHANPPAGSAVLCNLLLNRSMRDRHKDVWLRSSTGSAYIAIQKKKEKTTTKAVQGNIGHYDELYVHNTDDNADGGTTDNI